MTRPLVLDSYPLIAWLVGEAPAARVREWLREAERRERRLLVSLINLGEVYYILARRRGALEAKVRLGQIRALPLEVCPVSESLAMRAAEIKAAKTLSYADCFGVATALEMDADLATGDPDFKQVEDVVRIVWL